MLRCCEVVRRFEAHSSLKRAAMTRAPALLVLAIMACTSAMYWAGSVESLPGW